MFTRVSPLWRSLRGDKLLENSFFSLLATAGAAGLGFVFWVIASHTYTPSQVGSATSLISAMSLISYFSLFGFNFSVLRFLPASRNPGRDVDTGLTVVLVAGFLIAVLFVLTVPIFAPELAWLRSSFGPAITFCVVTAFAGANLYTDSIFVALRAAKYNALIDGVLQAGSKILFALPLIVWGAFGLVAASGFAATVAVVCSVFALTRLIGYRPRLRVDRHLVRRMAAFSASTYAASIFNLIPVLVLPFVVLNTLGSSMAGYFFIAFQIANLLYAISFAVSLSLFAEGSYEGVDTRRLMRRSALVLGWTVVPVAVTVAIASEWLLLIFGADYAREAAPALQILCVASIAVASYCWVVTFLKVLGRLLVLIVVNVAYAATIVLSAVLTTHLGLVWTAVAWLAGNLVATAIGGVALARPRHQPQEN